MGSAADSLPPDAWRPMPCATCARARITIDTRRSVLANGRAGSHVFARVRNTNPHAVALVVAFVPDSYGDADGYVPLEYWPLQLAPAGAEKAETVLMLKDASAREARIHNVERF